MLTYEECLAMCDLTEGEIEAIAEHEHMDPMIALALGQYLISHEGDQRIKSIILDDIRHAERSRNLRHAEVLRKVLQHFLATHPARDEFAAA
ncbi:hypothetical protein GCM10011348_18040 [Marinobacterium nitratireducens]|uniref:Uncharacterized protein n=1 Tax=Marinobacterium nitratireducens TaxID=518897 RepID=A0A917ZEX6_9GAMM|nr:hypothetical protein [Marinobacterium nitratireducens]GGO80719.1 hypothetical protein GCM10011348_18040 [Marinobacterium nitratireducens]